MKNRKGVIYPVVVVFQACFLAAGLAAIWHIPAWSKAKAEHKEAEYQSQKMWPQQEFAKLPGGEDSNK